MASTPQGEGSSRIRASRGFVDGQTLVRAVRGCSQRCAARACFADALERRCSAVLVAVVPPAVRAAAPVPGRAVRAGVALTRVGTGPAAWFPAAIRILRPIDPGSPGARRRSCLRFVAPFVPPLAISAVSCAAQAERVTAAMARTSQGAQGPKLRPPLRCFNPAVEGATELPEQLLLTSALSSPHA